MNAIESAVATEVAGELNSDDQAARPITSARRFCERTVEWLRTNMNLSTTVVPTHKIEDDTGRARLRGFVMHASRAGRYAMGGLWALALGAMLAMTSLPGMSASTRAALHTTGYGAQAVGAGLWAAALVVRRRHRTSALVELRASSAGPSTPDTVAALRADAKADQAWLVAEDGFGPAVLEAAKRLEVRCFTGPAGRQREVA